MAEVYRAHDQRLHREVALKVIAPHHLQNPAAVKRFEQEARTLAALAHPNILALYDLGQQEDTFFVVSELLDGHTLRQRLQDGPIPVRQAVELAVQVCRGLSAAHARGIVHRDLKPENLYLTRDSHHVKILDFGVAKLTDTEGQGVARLPGASEALTSPGVLVGTLGYLSPEQARGQAVDARSDLFALGTVLYEMVTGKRAFLGGTGADTLAALLTRDPPEMVAPAGPVPAPLEHVVRRCLQKERDERFQSAHDLAFALEALLAAPTAGGGELALAVEPRAQRRQRLARVALVVLGVLAVAAVGLLAGRALTRPSTPAFKQLTFRRGWINLARFAPDGRTVVYTAAWDGEPPEVFTTRTDTRESRPLGVRHAAILSVSSTGQLAILLDTTRGRGLFSHGTLATVPLGGGAPPREVLLGVTEADWTPDGRELCVLRADDGEQRIELPPGNLLYQSRRGLRLMRVSPDGRRVAFVEGSEAPLSIVSVEVARRAVSVLAADLPANLFGLAWARNRKDEIWFSAGTTSAHRDVLAVDLAGRRRLVYRSLATASLLDVDAEGRALLHRGSDRWGTRASGPGGQGEQDYSIFDASVPASISADGRTLLIDEFSEAASGGAVYVRRFGEGPAVRISDGVGWDVSADGRYALVRRGDPAVLVAVPTGPGLARPFELGRVSPRWGKWVPPAAETAVVLGSDAGRPLRLWAVGGKTPPRPLGPEAGFTNFAVAPDGRTVAARIEPGAITLLPIGGGQARTIRGIPADLEVGGFSGDGRGLFLVRTSVSVPCEVQRLDLRSRKVEPWMKVAPSDATGVSQCKWMNLAPDGRTYAYGYFQASGDLFVAEGLK
jgi:hypothetical protein